MVEAVLRLAEQDFIRVLRRRDTFWNLAGLGAGLFAFFGTVYSGILRTAGELVQEAPFLDDVGRNAAFLAEGVVLWVLALFFSARSLRQELESGTWLLLTQTPNPVRRILVGKALGVAAVLLFVHSVLSLFTFLYTPLIGLPFRAALAECFFVWLYVVGAVPEGMLYGYLARRRPRAVFLLYPATLLRLAMPLVLLTLAARGNDGGGVSLLSLGRRFFESRFDFQHAGVSMSAFFAAPWVPAAIVLGWQAASGLALWRVLVREAR